MKKSTFILLAILTILTTSCKKQPIASFSIDVSYLWSGRATVYVTNNSINADTYEWTLYKDGNYFMNYYDYVYYASYTGRTPYITLDQSGYYKLVLKASNSRKSSEAEQEFKITLTENNGNQDNQNEPTKTELLCRESGWILTAATCSPAYLLANGNYVPNLFVGFFEACELDDVVKFYTVGTQIINPYEKCYNFGLQETVNATWHFNDDETILTCQLPFFYNDEGTGIDIDMEKCTIVTLTSDKLELKYTFTDDEGYKGTYTFHLTYTPAQVSK